MTLTESSGPVNRLAAPRGTHDVLPPRSADWNRLEAHARAIAESFGYGEIRTPTFESTELFVRGVGETTDIVEKEMYTFQDKGDRSMTLRPEWTAPVVRAAMLQFPHSGAHIRLHTRVRTKEAARLSIWNSTLSVAWP